jgi:hypothetical protein
MRPYYWGCLIWLVPSQIQNANGTFLCPNKTYNFSSANASSSQGCSVFWNVGGGTAPLSNPATAGLMQVWFNDVPGGSASLFTTYSKCSVTAANGQSQLLTVYICSITNVALGALTLNGSTSGSRGLEFGSTAPVTLEVPLLAIPRNAAEPNPAVVLAEGYESTIPAGCLWPDRAVSTGPARLFLSFSDHASRKVGLFC